MSRLLVISPVRDEAERIAVVAASVAAQHRPPDRWLVVDDGSADGTPEVVRGLAREIPFLRLLCLPREDAGDRADGLAVASEARAFNRALVDQRWERYELVGKLDGDIVLDPDHYRRLLDEFERDPRLGIAGCYLEQEEGGRRTVSRMPGYHVNGALKLYRRECLQAIGGIRERLAWDTIDETHARMLGWRTQSLPDLRALHLRPSGAGGGILRGRARHGECVWIVGYPPTLVLARALRLAPRRPWLLGGAAFAAGYLRAAARRVPRAEDPGLVEFSRNEQRQRVRRALRRALSRRAAPAAERP